MENNPYAPSPSSLEGAASGVAPSQDVATTAFRDLSGITSKLSLLLLIGAGAKLLIVASSYMQLNLLTHPPFTTAEANANDVREKLTNFGNLILFFGTAIVFGRWIYLAHKNLPELGARYLRFTPGWSVGTFFVPVLNLWGPYQAVRDLAKASRNPLHWDLEDTSPLIVVWWVLWLLVQALGNGAFRTSMQAQSLGGLEEITMLDLTAGVLSVPLYFLARYIVRRIWRDQLENSARSADTGAVTT